MLEKMVFSMELHAGNDPAWLDNNPKLKQGAYDYANKILRDLEEIGMLPPFNYWAFHTDGDKADPKSSNYHIWEVEDD
jgi:hypothetical protein